MMNILQSLLDFITPEAHKGISDQVMGNLKDPKSAQTSSAKGSLMTQPVEMPEVPDLEQLHPNELRNVSTQADDGYVPAEGSLEGDGGDRQYQMVANEEAMAKLQAQMTGERDIDILRTDNQSREFLVSSVQKYENPKETGRINGPKGELFTVFDVPGSPIGEKNIGWGFKVEPEMMTSDYKKWPKVNGYPVDIRNGITRKQATTLLYQKLEESRKVCETQMPNWDKMTPMEKFFWNELAYNSGPNALKGSPRAIAAAKKGYTAEAAIKSLDFIRSGNVPMKGLLNRRIASYNEMAKELPGVPEIEAAEWGENIKVKFAHRIQSTKVSKLFADKVNSSTDGWYSVAKGDKGTKPIVYKV